MVQPLPKPHPLQAPLPNFAGIPQFWSQQPYSLESFAKQEQREEEGSCNPSIRAVMVRKGCICNLWAIHLPRAQLAFHLRGCMWIAGTEEVKAILAEALWRFSPHDFGLWKRILHPNDIYYCGFFWGAKIKITGLKLRPACPKENNVSVRTEKPGLNLDQRPGSAALGAKSRPQGRMVSTRGGLTLNSKRSLPNKE